MQSLQNKLFDVVMLKALPLAYTSCPELLKYWYFLKTCYPSKVHKCFKTRAVCLNMLCAEFFWHILLKTKLQLSTSFGNFKIRIIIVLDKKGLLYSRCWKLNACIVYAMEFHLKLLLLLFEKVYVKWPNKNGFVDFTCRHISANWKNTHHSELFCAL